MRVFRCYGTRSRAAGSRRTITGKSGLPELALLLSARSPVSPATQKMTKNAKCAFFVAMALGHARQAAGETLTCKSGLPELAPLLSTRSPVSPASLHQCSSVRVRPSSHVTTSRVLTKKTEIDVHSIVKQAAKWQVFRHVTECNTNN